MPTQRFRLKSLKSDRTMTSLVANYTVPRAQIRALTVAACPTRVVFLEGEENIGKSYLLTTLRPEITPAARLAIVDLEKRRGVATPLEILTEMAATIGSERFPKLRQALLEVARRPIAATVSGVSIKGSYNNVQAIAEESDDDRLLAAWVPTTAFLTDLLSLTDDMQPLVVAFDGYDGASPLVDKWFHLYLAPGLCEIAHIRLVVSARVAPRESLKQRVSTIATLDVKLSGVNDEQEWLPIIVSLKRRVPGSAPEQAAFLRGVIRALNGRPGGILPFILNNLELDT